MGPPVHDSPLTPAAVVGGPPARGRPCAACPAVGAVARRVAGLSSLLAVVTGPDGAPLTLALDVACPLAAHGTCHLSLCLSAGRLAVSCADPGPARGRLQ